MADFLLIHGSCHGAWCWRDLIPVLEEMGHSARATDMPGHGADPTPLDQVTLEGCRDAVLAASTPESWVVGHSWGGYPVSAAAESDPNKMRGLIYLAAYVPKSGCSMMDMRNQTPRKSTAVAITTADDGQSYWIEPNKAKAMFYHDCPAQAVAFAKANLKPQALKPQMTPLSLSARFDGVPKAYIRCLDDKTIVPEYQVQMTADWPTRQVFDMATSHSPFFSDPVGLAALLDQIAKQG